MDRFCFLECMQPFSYTGVPGRWTTMASPVRKARTLPSPAFSGSELVAGVAHTSASSGLTLSLSSLSREELIKRLEA